MCYERPYCPYAERAHGAEIPSIGSSIECLPIQHELGALSLAHMRFLSFRFSYSSNAYTQNVDARTLKFHNMGTWRAHRETLLRDA